MKIGIISGSHRQDGESTRIGMWLAQELAAQGAETYLLPLATAGLPLWDEGMWGKGETAPLWEARWTPIKAELAGCDGFVVLAPEYAGMAPAALKNFFLLATAAELGHKPALLAGVTSGATNGAYPIAELRASSTKNCKLCYLPEHLIFRHAGEILRPDVKPEFQGNDAYMQERSRWALGLLLRYAQALAEVRASGQHMHPKFAFGM